MYVFLSLYYKKNNDAEIENFIATNGKENPFFKKEDKNHLSWNDKEEEKKTE